MAVDAVVAHGGRPLRPSVVVHLVGEQDLASAPELRARLGELVGPGDRDVTLDLGGVTFFDTSGLDVIVDTYRLGRSTGATLTLRNVPPIVGLVLELTGARRLLH